MIKIIKQEIKINHELKSKVEWACRLNNTKPIFINGSLLKLEPTNIGYIEPHRYDNENSKKIYNDLKNIIKRYSSNTVNGYIILKNAYTEKEQLRFATISVQSPKEYDLKVK